MKNLNRLILGIYCLMSTNLYAGGERGNGGRSIVCTLSEPHHFTAELLDLYEGRTTRNIQVDESLLSLSREALVQEISTRLINLDPVEGKTLMEMLNSALQDIKTLEAGINITTSLVTFLTDRAAVIDDSYELFVPKNCLVEQFIIQRQPIFPEDRLLNIQKNIWLKMNAVNQVASLVHEVLLHRAINQYKIKNSLGTRYIVSKLFSKLMSRLDYIRLNASALIVIKPTKDEIKKPSTFPWKSVPAQYYFVEKTFENYSLSGLGYVNSKVGQCNLEVFPPKPESFSSSSDPSYYRIYKPIEVVGRRGRVMQDKIFSNSGGGDSYWSIVATILESGKCD